MLQGQSDRVETPIQAVFSEGVDLETGPCPVRGGHRLVTKVHGQLVTGRGQDVMDHRQDLVGLQHQRQNAVLEAVVVEDVCETRCDDTTEALVEERPRGMLTRRSTSKIIARQEDRRTLKARLVQKKFRVLRPVL